MTIIEEAPNPTKETGLANNKNVTDSIKDYCRMCSFFGDICKLDQTTKLNSVSVACPFYEEAKLIPKTKTELKVDMSIDTSHQTDLGYAGRLKTLHGDKFHFSTETNKFLVFDGQKWNDDKLCLMQQYEHDLIKLLHQEAASIDDYEKRCIAYQMALKVESVVSQKHILEAVKSLKGVPILTEAFDKDDMLFNVQNGTIDLRTGKIKPHDKADYISKISPVIYDPKAKCPMWLSFLNDIFTGRQDLIEYMQRQAGYYLTGLTKEEDFSIYHGTGGNGKSKYISPIMYILGEYALKIQVETLLNAKQIKSGSSSSGDIARLSGARLVVASEPDYNAELKEGLIKDLTGREPITARHLYQSEFTFTPKFKIVLITNHKPNIKSQDRGMWRRVKMTPFDVTIPDEKRDVDLDIKLKSESAGILNWMIEGCLKWQESGLKVPLEVIEATKEYKEEMDIFGDFFNVCCVPAKFEDRTPNTWLYEWVYKNYCEARGIKPWSQKAFTQSLTERGYSRLKVNNGRTWLKIALNPSLVKICVDMETVGEAMYSDGCRMMTDFILKCSSRCSHEDFLDNPSQPVNPSLNNGISKTMQNIPSLLEQATKVLKETYDKFSNPGKELPRLTSNMINKLMVEVEELEETDAKRIVLDYCKCRGW